MMSVAVSPDGAPTLKRMRKGTHSCSECEFMIFPLCSMYSRLQEILPVAKVVDEKFGVHSKWGMRRPVDNA
jgi:hypothetical protein